ncbi:MAG: type II toxin-antitoxin system VapC family toxin [Gammaproteobacteria bacterium]
MIFVDTNVFMYAVGRAHPLRAEAREFFRQALPRQAMTLCTSAEVMQELLHAYVPVGRISTLDAALQLVEATMHDIWPVEAEDIRTARTLLDVHPALGARDLVHLACCRRRGAARVKSFDRALASAFAAT